MKGRIDICVVALSLMVAWTTRVHDLSVAAEIFVSVPDHTTSRGSNRSL
jgi:hypothetical protein